MTNASSPAAPGAPSRFRRRSRNGRLPARRRRSGTPRRVAAGEGQRAPATVSGLDRRVGRPYTFTPAARCACQFHESLRRPAEVRIARPQAYATASWRYPAGQLAAATRRLPDTTAGRLSSRRGTPGVGSGRNGGRTARDQAPIGTQARPGLVPGGRHSVVYPHRRRHAAGRPGGEQTCNGSISRSARRGRGRGTDRRGRPRRPGCPGWTRGHVLTHLARNADGQTRMVEGVAARRSGRPVPGRGRTAHRATSKPARSTDHRAARRSCA